MIPKFYNDQNLFDAGKRINTIPHTKQEIIERFPELPIESVWKNGEYWIKTYDQMSDLFVNGCISSEIFDAYCAIWRNNTARLSSVCSKWEF
jgi:hypothetical protein